MNKKIFFVLASLAIATLSVNLLFFSLRQPTIPPPAGPDSEKITGFNYEKIESGLKLEPFIDTPPRKGP
ncbi:MAG: hypothetical protein NTY10_04920 [Candidatus Omnitrophica bacterium]|nr:hypothetical protein [Candidatus Omnitrophota bacterium]